MAKEIISVNKDCYCVT